MATVTNLQTNDSGETSRGVINTNFDNLNTDKIENITGESIGDLSDVDLTGLADNKILKYNATSTNFEIADDTGGVTASGTPVDNQIAVWTGASTIEGNSNLTWNGTTLNVGTESVISSSTNLQFLTPDITFGDGTGSIVLNANNGDYKFINGSITNTLDFTSTATTGKTFTFPNTTGTIALTSDINNIDETKLDTSVNASLDLADSALQDLVDDTTPQLGGNLDATDKNITGAGAISFTQELDNGTKSANFSIDFSTDQKQKVTLSAGTYTMTFDTTNLKVGNYLLKVVNGGTATLTIAGETGSVYWQGGTAPVFTESGTDLLAVYWDGSNFYCQLGTDFKAL